MLYSRYANPETLIKLYIKQGRFGKLVNEIFEAKQKEEQEKEEKEEELKLWIMYTRLLPDKSFIDWKRDLLTQPVRKGGGDAELDDEGIMNIINGLFSG